MKKRLTVVQLLEEKALISQLEETLAQKKADLLEVCHHPEELRVHAPAGFLNSPRSRPQDLCVICGKRLEADR